MLGLLDDRQVEGNKTNSENNRRQLDDVDIHDDDEGKGGFVPSFNYRVLPKPQLAFPLPQSSDVSSVRVQYDLQAIRQTM
jgi:hypothetical protein